MRTLPLLYILMLSSCILRVQTDEISELVMRTRSSSKYDRSAKYFDPVEGPRESMALGKRPSVRDMLKKRSGVHGSVNNV